MADYIDESYVTLYPDEIVDEIRRLLTTLSETENGSRRFKNKIVRDVFAIILTNQSILRTSERFCHVVLDKCIELMEEIEILRNSVRNLCNKVAGLTSYIIENEDFTPKSSLQQRAREGDVGEEFGPDGEFDDELGHHEWLGAGSQAATGEEFGEIQVG